MLTAWVDYPVYDRKQVEWLALLRLIRLFALGPVVVREFLMIRFGRFDLQQPVLEPGGDLGGLGRHLGQGVAPVLIRFFSAAGISAKL